MSRLHLRVPYHLPSWQGGDFDHPRCRKPEMGTTYRWVVAGYDLTDALAEVNCPVYLELAARGRWAGLDGAAEAAR